MSSAAKNNGTNVGAGGGFMSKMDHFLYSEDKKHIAAGIAVLTVIFGIPWYFMNRGLHFFFLPLRFDLATKINKIIVWLL